MVHSISAVAAYQRAIEANKKIKSSFQAQNQKMQPSLILRIGDDLTPINQSGKSSGAIPGVAKPGESFGDIFKREFLDSPLSKISSTSKTLFNVDQADDAGSLGPDMIEMIEALDEMQIAVNTIVGIRDKFIEAYKSIINMPI